MKSRMKWLAKVHTSRSLRGPRIARTGGRPEPIRVPRSDLREALQTEKLEGMLLDPVITPQILRIP